MIHSIYSVKDATIYDQYPTLNTGIDQLLEISKVIDGTASYNSRILIKFDLGNFTANFTNSILTQTASYFLKLTATQPTEIPLEYEIYAYPVSRSYNMGTGIYSTKVTGSSNGVSWGYRLSYNNSSDTGSAWATSSFANGTTGSWSIAPGGGTWYTASAHSQSFVNQTTDVEMNVTTAVRNWLSNTVPNEGFILLKDTADEVNLTEQFGSLRFYSRDTNTIYSPQLELRYDDSVYQTSHSIVDYTDEVVVNLTNLQEYYYEEGSARINISARPKYPTRTHTTSSNYLDLYQLSSSSFYSIRDAHTNNEIIPFDESNTKISADSRGSYFMLNTNTLAPERYYRLLIKSKVSSNEQYIYDSNWIFKVVQ